MIILEKTFYIAPVIKYAVLGNRPMLCGSPTQKPVGIMIADYDDVNIGTAEGNDW